MCPSSSSPILVVGHVTRDLIGGEKRLGGAAAYVARALSARGLEVALVTRAPDDPLLLPLSSDPRIRLHRLASDTITTFRHDFEDGRRRLRLTARAAALTAADIPAQWRNVHLVFLVPVMQECGTDLLTAFPESECVVGSQGWLREVGTDGRVRQSAAPQALLSLRMLAVTLSEEDHPEAEVLARRMSRHCRVAALTRGSKGRGRGVASHGGRYRSNGR